MALIKCPECQAEISDKAISCPKCGYSAVGRENVTVESVKLPKKRFLHIGIVIGIIIFLIGIMCIWGYKNKIAPVKEAIEIISHDKGDNGKELTFYRIYYNDSENACVVYFNNGKIDDVAVVQLDSKEVGYKALYDILALGMMLAESEEQKQEIAQGIISDPYDPTYVYNVEKGDETWKLVYQNK